MVMGLRVISARFTDDCKDEFFQDLMSDIKFG